MTTSMPYMSSSGKPMPDVDHDQVPAVLVDGHVLADLVESAQRNNF